MGTAVPSRGSLLKRILTAGLLVGAFLLAIRSRYTLVRVGALLAATGLIAAWLLVRALPRRRLRIVMVWWWGAIIIVGISFFTAAWWLGGSAINGKVDLGHYYLVEHGHATEVSAQAFYTLASLELVEFLLVPAGFLLASASESVVSRRSSGHSP